MTLSLPQELPHAKPFIRWAGSKRATLPLLLGNTPKDFSTYYEPFVGSGQLFFALNPKRSVLGDLNEELIRTYQTIANRANQVTKAIDELSIGKDAYYEIRSWIPSQLPDVTAAARFIYLNRYAFNGVWRTNRSGAFNVPYGARQGRAPSAEVLAAAGRRLRRARLVHGDFAQTAVRATGKSFVYLDPPYWPNARKHYGEYGYQSFSESDEPRFMAQVRRLNELGAKVLISLDYSEERLSSLVGWHTLTFTRTTPVGGSVVSRKTSTECIVANYPLSFPPGWKGSPK